MIFCSSQFPLDCSPTCPLSPVLLVCEDRGWSSYPFFPSCWREHPHLTLLGVVLVLGWWAGSGLGKGQAALPSFGCHQAADPPHLTPSWQRDRSIS